MNITYKQNLDSYNTKYKEGYGNKYPESRIIRVFHRIIKHHITKGKILDFRCGNGIHLKYFQELGFEPYGCDASVEAIKLAKKNMPNNQNHLFVSPYVPNLLSIFKTKFDLIMANYSLYYLNDEDMRDVINQFHKLLKEDGLIFVSMMSKECYYYDLYSHIKNGLYCVQFKGRVNVNLNVNMKSKEEMLNLFSKFTKLHIGRISYKIREDEGTTDHYLYIGKKVV